MTAAVEKDHRELSPSLPSAWEVLPASGSSGPGSLCPFPHRLLPTPCKQATTPTRDKFKVRELGAETQGWEKEAVGTGWHFSCPERQRGCFSSRI